MRNPRSISLRTAFWLLAAAIPCVAGSALAADPVRFPLPESIQAARAARGPDRYTAMRSIWRAWDQSDPSQVEGALHELASDGDPAQRVYASLLEAYARRRRGDLEGARTRIKTLGFVNQWLVVGPFDNEGRAGLARVFEPESSLTVRFDPHRAFQGKERPVRWRAVPDSYPFAWVDLGDLLRPKDKVCGYATTFVRDRKAKGPRQASVWIGVSGAFKAFFNGEEVLSDSSYRDLDSDRMATPVTLAPGWNQLTLKICADDSPPMLSVRVADARGTPDAAIESSSDVNLAEQAARNLIVRKAAPANDAKVVLKATGKQAEVETSAVPPVRTQPPGGPSGPLQQFQRIASGNAASAEMLEAYARYLLFTGGDDPAENKVREFARKAAERAPSVDRFLLAAIVAEDRNQAREWVDKAAALSRDPNDVKVLLAQARLARTSPNWRDAVPLFDRVLRIDPDNAEAILGRVDLFNEAGLKRTALVTLENALERNPRSVGLLGATAAQLSSLDRQAEAAEISDRYAAYRFDDATWLATRVQLAVARRDKVQAEHWIQRMLAIDPGSAHALGVAASAWFRLGMHDKSLAMFDRALELAPEDTDTMREKAGVLGDLGRRDEQVTLLRKVLALRPQLREVRDYLEHIEPSRPKADEAWAWEPDRFLGLRATAAQGFNQRTLRSLQVTTVYESGLSSRFHQIVYQPLTDEAAATARQYAFVYQADRESVQLRGGRVFRADGRIDEAIETNEGPADDPDIAMYTSARTFFVHFPRVNPGDIVELRYRIEDVTPQNAFADYFGEIFFLQSSSPVQNSEYVVLAPKSRPLYVRAANLPGLVREDKDLADSHQIRFFLPSSDAILPEPSMPPWAEQLGSVHVSTYKSWDDVGKWYWGIAKDQLVPDDEVKALVERVTKGLTSNDDKVRAIYKYVVQRTRYVALEFGIYGYKPRRASQTFARGWGDCKDKAALIVSMLRVAGIPANMVLVRTGMRGAFPSDPASIAPFDHAIAYVPSLDLFLDGTAQFTGSRELPAFDRGSLALVVGENGSSRLVNLPEPPPEDTRRVRQLEATIAANGSAALDMRLETTGAFAPQWRDRYHSPGTRRDRLAHDLASDLVGFELTPGPGAIETSDLEDIEQPARVRVRGRAPQFAKREGDDLSVPVTPGERFVASLASLSQRKLDLKLRYNSTLDDTWTVRVPQGMLAKSVPTPASGTSPFGSYELTVERKDNAIVVHSKVVFRKTRITPTEYPAFLAFCEETDRALAQRVVLGKSQH